MALESILLALRSKVILKFCNGKLWDDRQLLITANISSRCAIHTMRGSEMRQTPAAFTSCLLCCGVAQAILLHSIKDRMGAHLALTAGTLYADLLNDECGKLADMAMLRQNGIIKTAIYIELTPYQKWLLGEMRPWSFAPCN